MKAVDISTKLAMQQYLRLGLFGNTAACWDTPHEMRQAGYTGKVWFRARGNNVRNVFGVANQDVERVYNELTAKVGQGWLAVHEEFSEEVKESRVFSGEISRIARRQEGSEDSSGLYLLWSRFKGNIRIALHQYPEPAAYNLRAVALLNSLMEPSDVEQLLGLLDKYPDATVEFSYFGKATGMLHEKLVIWEVRSY